MPERTTYEANVERYFAAIRDTNRTLNLTAIVDPEEMRVKHLEDTETLFPLLDREAPRRLIDIGTGAGIPGMILKIAYPRLHVVLLDSLRKRIDFLAKTAEALGLRDLEMLHGRAEDYAAAGKAGTLRESFDVAVSRAVAAMPTLVEYVLPYVRQGGLMVAMKGPAVEEELQAAERGIAKLGGELEDVMRCTLSDGSRRMLVCIRKRTPTPPQYPRGQNKPKIKPIG